MDGWGQSGNNYDNGYLTQGTDAEQEAKSRAEESEKFKQMTRERCSLLGFSLAAFLLLHEASGFLFIVLYRFLSSRPPGPLVDMFLELFHFSGFMASGSSIFAYVMILPAMGLILQNVPKTSPIRKRMRVRKWFMFLFLAMGLGYMANIFGTFLLSLLSGLIERSVEDMTPVNNVLEQLGWTTAIYIGIVGPVLEELVFRGMILDRVRPFGEKAAIIFSSVVFGLMHGNLSQFLYASSIGLVLGYVAVKTGRLIYSMLIHIATNSYTVIWAGGLLKSMQDGDYITTIGIAGLLSVATIGIMVAAAVILGLNCRKTKLRRGEYPVWMEYRDFSSQMYKNPGVLFFTVLCVLTIFYYLFLA